MYLKLFKKFFIQKVLYVNCNPLAAMFSSIDFLKCHDCGPRWKFTDLEGKQFLCAFFWYKKIIRFFLFYVLKVKFSFFGQIIWINFDNFFFFSGFLVALYWWLNSAYWYVFMPEISRKEVLIIKALCKTSIQWTGKRKDEIEL